MIRFVTLVLLGVMLPQFIFCQEYSIIWQPVRQQRIPALQAELRAWEVYQVDASYLAQTAMAKAEGASLALKMGAKNIRLTLFPDDIRSRGYRLMVASENGIQDYGRGTVRTYGGHTDSGGHVRLTLDSDFIFGYWEANGQTWYVQPLRDFYSAAPNDYFVVYEAGAVKPVANARCGFTHTAHLKQRSAVDGSIEKMNGQCYEVEIALASDFSMFQAYGSVSGVQNFTLGVLNNVQTNYDNEFADEVRYVAVANFVSSCATCDPWTSSTSSNTVLASFRDWGNAGGFGIPFDVASFWTNRDFNGDVIGLAWLGSVCTNFRYNILQRFSTNANLLRVLQAHELGHNFDSGHDAAGSPTIMAPSVSSSAIWSGNSVSVINSYISSLASSGNCIVNCSSSGNLAPSPVVQLPFSHVCPGSLVPIIDGSTGNPTSWFWSLPGAEPSSSSEQNPVVVYNNPGTYPIQLTATNIFGSNTGNSDFDITVDDQGAKYLWYETFENGFGEWQVINPDNQTGWQIKNVGGSPYGKKSAWMNHFGYAGTGQVDGMLSPLISLANVSSPTLQIDYAYRRRVTSSSEQLRVKVSTDGGVTFPHTIFSGQENGSGVFATGPLTNQSFTPAVPGDWCYQDNPGSATCLEVSLAQFIGQSNVRVLIESVNAGNNNLYIDNIRLQVDCIPAIPPTAAIGAAPTSGCAPLTVFFQDNSSGVVESRLWNFPGGDPTSSTDAFPAVTYPQAGTYNVALEVFNGSGSSLAVETDLIQVIDVPVANFTFSINGNSVQFQNTTQGQGLISWNFGNGQTSTQINPTITYSSPGIYLVRLTVTNACGQSIKETTLQIIGPPTAAFTASPTIGCAPLAVQFTSQATGNPSSLQWLFPGGQPTTSTQPDPLVTYSMPGQYTAYFVVANAAGSDTLDILVEVGDIPTAGFQTSYQVGQSQAVFSNTSSSADSFRWEIAGQILTDSILTFTFPEDGNYEILLIATNGCGVDTASQILTITTPPTAGFTTNSDITCTPAWVQFQNQSSPNSTSFFWQFPGGIPDTSTLPNPLVQYQTAGNFEVVLIVGNPAGVDTLTQNLIVGAPPVAGFEWSYLTGDTIVYCTNTTSGADSIRWETEGQTSTASNPVFSFPEDGMYEIRLIAFNTCGADTSVQVVEVVTPPVAGFGWLDAFCAPTSVQLQQSASINTATYHWLMPGAEPSSSDLPNPVAYFAEPGNYQITLIVTNAAGADTLLQTLVLLELPEASYSFEIVGDTVSFISQSQNADTHLWEFGDGSSSEESNPEHHYGADGVYTVRLIVGNSCGLDTVTFSLEIFTALPSVNFQANQVRGCAPLEVQFTADTEYADSLLWILPGAEPDTSELPNPLVRYPNPGTYSVTLTARNSNGGASISRIDFIEVTDVPVSGFNFAGNGTIFEFQPIQADLPGYSFFWSFGDGLFSNLYAPAHEYGGSGIYSVTLEITNECGVVVTSREVEVTVNGIMPGAGTAGFRVYPNPSEGQVWLECDVLPTGLKELELTLRDVTGRRIQQTRFETEGDSFRRMLNLEHFPSGVYLYEFTNGLSGRPVFSGRLVLIR